MNAEKAAVFFYKLAEEIKRTGIHVKTGIFQASMKVELVNDGPYTIIMDSD
jgi:D-tyrosyl-tRNA(Tyr) deacylase